MGKDDREPLIEKFRGEFIGKMVRIEIVLSMLLSAFISEEKYNYCMFIFTKLDMSKKVEILKQIIKDKEPTFIKYSYKEIIDDIGNMQNIRNLFAHSLAEIPFYGYKENKKIISDKIKFRNAKKIGKDFWLDSAYDYEINAHAANLKKLDKIYKSLFDIFHHINKAHSLNK